MSPFSVTVQQVPDRELGPLLIQLARAGFHDPLIERAGAAAHPTRQPFARLGAQAISRTSGGSWGSGRGSRISGRVGASTTRGTASSSARRAPKAPFTSDSARRFASTSGDATESTS